MESPDRIVGRRGVGVVAGDLVDAAGLVPLVEDRGRLDVGRADDELAVERLGRDDALGHLAR